MELTKEEKVQVIIDRITTRVSVSAGGGQYDSIYEDKVNPKKLAEVLLDLIK